MRHTTRDERLIRDIALSHILSRDQILKLGYFGSVTRLNSRMRTLRANRLVSISDTPFFNQYLYLAGKKASEIVGNRVARMMMSRAPTPRFVQHALAVTEVRIALQAHGYTDWRFEAQLTHSFLWGGKQWVIRPDGMVRTEGMPVLLEVDMGHVDPGKFAHKLKGYQAFLESGELFRTWTERQLSVLTITTGTLRRRRLEQRVPRGCDLHFQFDTFDNLGIAIAGGWS